MKKWDLTEEHKKQIPAWNERWKELILSTEHIDFERTKEAVLNMYDAAGLARPLNVVRVPSAMVGAIVFGCAAVYWKHMKNNSDAHTTNLDTSTYTAVDATNYTAAATSEATTYAAIRTSASTTAAATFAASRSTTSAAAVAATRAITYDATTSSAIDLATETTTYEATIDSATRVATSASSAATSNLNMTEHANFSMIFDVAYSVVSKKLGKDVREECLDAVRKWSIFYNGGSEWASWCCYLSFVRDVIGWKHPSHKNYAFYEQAAIHGGPRFVHEKFVLLCDRAKMRKMDSRNQLHCENGAAIEWNCGTKLYYLNGTKMKPEHVLTPSEKLDPELVVKEENLNVKRELLRKIGLERFIHKMGAITLDKRGDYELLSIDKIGEIKNCRFLKMRNPSIGVWHVEEVDEKCNTVQESINWRAYGDSKKMWKPEVVT